MYINPSRVAIVIFLRYNNICSESPTYDSGTQHNTAGMCVNFQRIFYKEKYMEVKEVAKIYKEIESKFNGNLAAMYQYADSIYGELAEKNTDEKKIHLYLMVRDVISHNIVSEYMKGNGYIFDEDTQSWIPKKVIFTLNI